MRLQPAWEHCRRLSDTQFDTFFSADMPLVFVYHGHPRFIHRLTCRPTKPKNLHAREYKKEDTTTAPFDKVVRNDPDRCHFPRA